MTPPTERDVREILCILARAHRVMDLRGYPPAERHRYGSEAMSQPCESVPA